jgi:hypothetical protein
MTIEIVLGGEPTDEASKNSLVHRGPAYCVKSSLVFEAREQAPHWIEEEGIAEIVESGTATGFVEHDLCFKSDFWKGFWHVGLCKWRSTSDQEWGDRA